MGSNQGITTLDVLERTELILDGNVPFETPGRGGFYHITRPFSVWKVGYSGCDMPGEIGLLLWIVAVTHLVAYTAYVYQWHGCRTMRQSGV